MFRKMLNRLFKPPLRVLFAVDIVAFPLVIYSLKSLSSEHPVALAGAVMSMFSLQTSMLHVFGTDNERHFRRVMNTVTGSIVMAIVLAIATYMIINGTRKTDLYKKQTGGLDNE